jgi:hypothetical protein
MLPGLSTRSRRVALVLGIAVMCGASIWIARRVEALCIIQEQGVQCDWEVPEMSYSSPLVGDLLTLLPTSRLEALRDWGTSGGMTDGRKLGWAARTLGPQQELFLIGKGADDPSQLRAFFLSLGQQPALRKLTISNHSETAWETVLRQFPNLRELHLVNIDASGAHFPTYPALKELLLRWTPITDEGLRAVLRCPALEVVQFDDTAITAAGIRQIPQWRQPALQEIYIVAPRFQETEAAALQEELRNACPGLKCTVITKSPYQRPR